VHGPKIEELEILLQELVVEGGEKAVVFSQWLRMTELIENMLKKNGIGYVHLNGSVPSKNRGGLMKRFKEDPDCKVFLSTDAGGVGLNLQSGSVVVNMDIPWNPAILEQRIGRVHRMGQNRAVRVVNFVSRASIEERILNLLRFKKSLFAGALDEDGADVVMVGESGMEKLIQSVEEAVTPLATPDPELVRQETVEEQTDERNAELRDRAEEEASAVAGAGGKAGSGAESGMVAAPGKAAGTGPGTALDDRAGTAGPSGAGSGMPPGRTGAATGLGTGPAGSDGGTEALNALLLNGAQFLMSLSLAIAPPAGVQNALQGVIGRDEATGKTYLKIPLPEAEAMNRIVSGLGQLLEGFLGMNRQR
jgi:superfamily II DNA/RNA helicase